MEETAPSREERVLRHRLAAALRLARALERTSDRVASAALALESAPGLELHEGQWVLRQGVQVRPASEPEVQLMQRCQALERIAERYRVDARCRRMLAGELTGELAELERGLSGLLEGRPEEAAGVRLRRGRSLIQAFTDSEAWSPPAA